MLTRRALLRPLAAIAALYVPIQLPPGVAIGSAHSGQSFAAYQWYVPTMV